MFRLVAEVYKAAMVVHGMTEPVSIILVEDETKFKSRVSWEAKRGTLAGF